MSKMDETYVERYERRIKEMVDNEILFASKGDEERVKEKREKLEDLLLRYKTAIISEAIDKYVKNLTKNGVKNKKKK